jgi:hypothetical protein
MNPIGNLPEPKIPDFPPQWKDLRYEKETIIAESANNPGLGFVKWKLYMNVYKSGVAKPIKQAEGESTTRVTLKITLDPTYSYTARLLWKPSATYPDENSSPMSVPRAIPVKKPDMRYFFSSAGPSRVAYIFRADVDDPTPHNITLYLPNIFAAEPPALGGVSVDPFMVKTTGNKDIPYVITLSEDSIAWKFDADGIRSGLKDAYVQFFKNLETSGMQPGALELVRHIIARGIPLTFTETLYYTYGFNPTDRYINVQPGMRLRIDYQTHQIVGPDKSERYLNGYVGTSSGYYNVGSFTDDVYNVVKIGADSFLNWLDFTTEPNGGGAGGIMDITSDVYKRPYFRLFYPPTFSSSDSNGYVGISHNVALVGANTYAKLEEATEAGGNFNLSGVISTFFRGRVTVVPEILCFIQNSPFYVPVGTTVRQLIEQVAAIPLAEKIAVSEFTYTRSVASVTDIPYDVVGGLSLFRKNRINFTNLQKYIGGKTYLDLPVLHGDSLVFEEGP